jgi:cob(I)alamin adenosyltransferase
MKKSRRSITTGAGDRGMTRLFSGEEVSKDSPRPEACGDVDELVAALGIARALVKKAPVRDAILYLQRSLFTVAAELATSRGRLDLLKKRVNAAMVRELDRKRAALERSIRMPRGFIIPGGSTGAAHLDHARAVARRCERKVVALAGGEIPDEHLLVWMNRLSDYLWLLARQEEGRPLLLRSGRSRKKSP